MLQNKTEGCYAIKSPNLSYFYYNDRELLSLTDNELESEVLKFKNRGIKYVIGFSVTHFRWSFYPYESLILKAIARYIKAFHKHGIKFVEHHSANLLWNNEQKNCRPIVETRFARRQSQLENWLLLEKYWHSDWTINGVEVSSMMQVDGRSGEHAFADNYGAKAFCHNNPDYVNNYLNYLEKLYKLGIDGIMTDDIEFFYEHSCACRYCRAAFLENYGFKLPKPGKDWHEWYGNYENPSFLSWLKFRNESSLNFHKKVQRHYQRLGLKMFRPWYRASGVGWYGLYGYVFDDIPALDVAYQENMYDVIIRYSWIGSLVEAAHRYALGRSRNIPSVSQFYPERTDALNFSWSLAMCGGQGFMGTTHNSQAYPVQQELFLRKFEQENAGYLANNKKIANIAFLDTLDNRRYYQHYNDSSALILKSLAQACIRNNMSWDFLLESEFDHMKKFELLILPELAVVSSAQIEKLRDYVMNGGILLWCGKSVSLDKNNRPVDARKFFPELAANTSCPQTVRIGKGEIVIPEVAKVNSFSYKNISAPRWKNGLESSAKNILPVDNKKNIKEIADYLRSLLPHGTCFKLKNAPDDLLVTFFKNPDGNLIFHIVNAVESLNNPDSRLSHADPIPFPVIAREISMEISDKYLTKSLSDTKVQLHVPGEKPVNIEYKNDGCIKFNMSHVKFYGLLTIE